MQAKIYFDKFYLFATLAHNFPSMNKLYILRKLIFIAFTLFSTGAFTQKVEKIFVNLYTDSLKKGTYNYINIDGQLSNGKYLPLDSTEIIFWASDGKFFGNQLFIDKNFSKEKIDIKVNLKQNPAVAKEFTLYIKQKPDDERLKTADELLNQMQPNSKKSKRKKGN